MQKDIYFLEINTKGRELLTHPTLQHLSRPEAYFAWQRQSNQYAVPAADCYFGYHVMMSCLPSFLITVSQVYRDHSKWREMYKLRSIGGNYNLTYVVRI